MAKSRKKWPILATLLFLPLPVPASCFLVPSTHWDWRAEIGPLKMGIIETDLMVQREMDEQIDPARRQVMLFIEPQSITLPCSLLQLSSILTILALIGIATTVFAFAKRNKTTPRL